MIAVAAVVVLLLAGGGGWFFLFRGSAPVTPASSSVATVEKPPAPATTAAIAPRPSPPATAATQPQTPPSQPVTATTQPQTPPAPPPTGTAATTSPAAAPAPQPRVAAVDLSLIRNQVAQLAAGQQCATVDGDVAAGGAVTLSGLAGVSAANALRQGLAGLTLPGAVQWQVQSVDQAFCPALDVLHPIAPTFDPASARLGLTLVGGNTRLRDGEHILPQVVMPNFPAHLRVDYIAHDGGVLHLYPQVADPSQHLSADPAHVYRPGAAINLGVVSAGHPAWEVGPPYGTDMIIAIASAQPLFDRPRPSNGEDTTSYLHALESAVQAAQSRGVQMTGSAITVDTLPKR